MVVNIDMSTNNKCDICMPEGLDYCITNEELSSAIGEAKSDLLTVIRNLENNTYSKADIDQLIANIEAGVVDLSDYYNKATIDAKFNWVYGKLDELANKTVNIDENLSSTSTNPVQNKVITEGLLTLRSDVNNLQRQVGEIDTILNNILYTV